MKGERSVHEHRPEPETSDWRHGTTNPWMLIAKKPLTTQSMIQPGDDDAIRNWFRQLNFLSSCLNFVVVFHFCVIVLGVVSFFFCTSLCSSSLVFHKFDGVVI